MTQFERIKAALESHGWIMQETSYFGGYATVRWAKGQREAVWVKRDDWLRPIFRVSK